MARARSITLLSAAFATAVAGLSLAQNPPRGDERLEREAVDASIATGVPEAFAPESAPTPESLDLPRLERRHRRHSSNPAIGGRLAEAYLLLGRAEDAKRVLQRFAGRRFTPATMYFLLASIHFAEGEYLRAEAVCATGLRRHRKDAALAALHARARTRQGHVAPDAWAMRDALRATPALGLQVVALDAFEQGDIVTGLLAAEALYYEGGYAATNRAVNKSVELVYDGLIRAAAKGRDGIAREYPPGSFEDRYRASLLAAADEVVADLSRFASRLELFAAIRIRALEHYLAAHGTPGGEPARRLADDRPYVAEVLGSVVAARRAGRLRWYTMASLLELDLDYFAALTHEQPEAWAEVQAAFGRYSL